jgi:hypothetical protein
MAIIPMFDSDFEALETAVLHLREANDKIRSVTTCAALLERMPEIADRLVTIADDLDIILNADMHADLAVEKEMFELLGDIDLDESGDD